MRACVRDVQEDKDAEYARIRSMDFIARRKYKKRAKVIQAQQAADQAYRRAPTSKKDAKLTQVGVLSCALPFPHTLAPVCIRAHTSLQIRNVDHRFLSPVYIEPGMKVEDRLHKVRRTVSIPRPISARSSRPLCWLTTQ